MYKIDLLSNNPIESIYIKIKRQSCQEAGFSLAKRYFELGTSMKRLTRLLSLLSFSGGPAAQDLWSSPGTDEKKWIASYVLAQNDSWPIRSRRCSGAILTDRKRLQSG